MAAKPPVSGPTCYLRTGAATAQRYFLCRSRFCVNTGLVEQKDGIEGYGNEERSCWNRLSANKWLRMVSMPTDADDRRRPGMDGCAEEQGAIFIRVARGDTVRIEDSALERPSCRRRMRDDGCGWRYGRWRGVVQSWSWADLTTTGVRRLETS